MSRNKNNIFNISMLFDDYLEINLVLLYINCCNHAHIW